MSSDDIVTRLRRHDHDWLPDTNTLCDYCDSLYEIERLRAAGDALAEALRRILDGVGEAVEEDDLLDTWEEARRG